MMILGAISGTIFGDGSVNGQLRHTNLNPQQSQMLSVAFVPSSASTLSLHPVSDMMEHLSGFAFTRVDIGTGDGRDLLRWVEADISGGTRAALGLDPEVDRLGKTLKAGRKRLKGRNPSPLMFVQSSLERLPPELRGVGDLVTCILPWGSLLRMVTDPQVAALEGMARLGKPGGAFRILINLQPFQDPALCKKLGLVAGAERLSEHLERHYKMLGFSIRDLTYGQESDTDSEFALGTLQAPPEMPAPAAGSEKTGAATQCAQNAQSAELALEMPRPRRTDHRTHDRLVASESGRFLAARNADQPTNRSESGSTLRNAFKSTWAARLIRGSGRSVLDFRGYFPNLPT